ncbi:hypothetical protein [Hymenobacter canadensis]|uniref:HTH cro/C1-type domain-containing protein n=1 Tax=Hymenobacter canadensis TaxID=2999067 RepID=A0ABY7LR98_9BACT|nr:hypothetical protein [Hymenobacter canadensis]WBA42951.1 hypothetical protein O3303_05155 [Hymenobacter canadensis]
MSEETVSQRIKFLIESLRMNPRSFSIRYGVNEGTTRNYIDRGSIPNAEYIATLVRSIDNLNPAWLLLGKGEMFLTGAGEVQLVDVKRPDDVADFEKEALRKENELLRSQVQDKERIIQLLELQLNK